jgi:hypothetical protein
MIHFNDPAYNDERCNNHVPRITTIKDIIKTINSLAISPNNEKKIQQLIYDYENLRHYRARTEGMQLIDGTVLKFGEDGNG